MNDRELEAGERLHLLTTTAESSGRVSQRRDGSREVTVSCWLEGSRLRFEAQERSDSGGSILASGTSIDLRDALAIDEDVPIKMDNR